MFSCKKKFKVPLRYLSRFRSYLAKTIVYSDYTFVFALPQFYFPNLIYNAIKNWWERINLDDNMNSLKKQT